MSSRYSSITLLPYYIALASQVLAAIYAMAFIPETLHQDDLKEDTSTDATSLDDGHDDDEEEHEGGIREIVEDTMEAVVAPVQPLRLLLPHRNSQTGHIEWRLFLVTISLLATTCGVSEAPAPLASYSDTAG